MYRCITIAILVFTLTLTFCGKKEVKQEETKSNTQIEQKQPEKTTEPTENKSRETKRDEATPEKSQTSPENKTRETKRDQEISKEPEKGPGLSQMKESDLWQFYNQNKAKAKIAIENNKVDDIVYYFEKAGEAATQLNRPDIAAWQYNNIGYHLIEHFKKETDYDSRLSILNQMPAGKEKTEYHNNLKSLFSKNINNIKNAKSNLIKAKEIDDKLEASNRTNIIANNINFTNYIESFVK